MNEDKKAKQYLLPIEVGKCVIEGQRGKVLSMEPYVKVLENPTWNGEDWVCLAQVESTLCLISVKPYRSPKTVIE